MTTPTWPATLPQKFLRDGFSIGPKSLVIGFDTEVGAGKTRRRSNARVFKIKASVRFEPEFLDDFETFYQNDLSDGAKPFYGPDGLTDNQVLYRFDPGADPQYVLTNPHGAIIHVDMSLIRIG